MWKLQEEKLCSVLSSRRAIAIDLQWWTTQQQQQQQHHRRAMHPPTIKVNEISNFDIKTQYCLVEHSTFDISIIHTFNFFIFFSLSLSLSRMHLTPFSAYLIPGILIRRPRKSNIRKVLHRNFFFFISIFIFLFFCLSSSSLSWMPSIELFSLSFHRSLTAAYYQFFFPLFFLCCRFLLNSEFIFLKRKGRRKEKKKSFAFSLLYYKIHLSKTGVLFKTYIPFLQWGVKFKFY